MKIVLFNFVVVIIFEYKKNWNPTLAYDSNYQPLNRTWQDGIDVVFFEILTQSLSRRLDNISCLLFSWGGFNFLKLHDLKPHFHSVKKYYAISDLSWQAIRECTCDVMHETITSVHKREMGIVPWV